MRTPPRLPPAGCAHDGRSVHRLPPPGVTQLLERFHALDASGDGLIEQAEFVAALGLEAAPLFDPSGGGACRRPRPRVRVCVRA